jgi:hypothetical protein
MDIEFPLNIVAAVVLGGLIIILVIAYERYRFDVDRLLAKGDVESLIKALRRKKKAIAAAIALGKLKDRRATKPLLDALMDVYNPVIIDAVNALGSIGDEDAVSRLFSTLTNFDFLPNKKREDSSFLYRYKSVVIRAMLNIGGTEAEAIIEKIENGEMGEELQNILREIKGVEKQPKKAFLPEDAGFMQIASITFGFPCTIYWHPHHKMELMVSSISDRYLVKGMKKYYIKAVSESGQETWERNFGEMMEKLKVSFPEFHLYSAGVMNVTPEMIPDAYAEIDSSRMQLVRVAGELTRLTGEKDSTKDAIATARKVKRSTEVMRETFKEYHVQRPVEQIQQEFEARDREKDLEKEEKEVSRAIKEKRQKVKELQESIEDKIRIVKEFQEKGVATCYVIGYSTVLRIGSDDDLKVMVEKAIEDITIADTYGGFTQSLERNLRIYHEEVEYPWLTHVAEYVGLFHPADIKEFDKLREQVMSFFMLTADRDLTMGAETVKGKKTPARVFKAFLERVDTVPFIRGESLPTEGGWMGNVMYGNHTSTTPFFFPIHKLNHGYISGTTGSGKSYLARVMVENAILEGVNVVLFDTTRQWCGIVSPAKGKILRRFDKLKIDRRKATGFPARVYTPMGSGLEMPKDKGELFDGCSIISMRGLDDKERGMIAKDVLQYAYDNHEDESETLKTLIVIEEAHSFLPENVSPEAKNVATEVRNLIDRIAREMRKYGLNFLLITQSLSDFKREARIVREMTNSKFFMRAMDRTEVSYVEDYVSTDASLELRRLKEGEALVFAPFVNTIKLYVRPPFSHVGELSPKELQEAMRLYSAKEDFLQSVGGAGVNQRESIEEQLMRIAKKHQEQGTLLNMTEMRELLGITSKKRMTEILKRLEAKGLIKTKMTNLRGNPKVIIPVE